jgi:hypothetical protein
MKTTFSFRWAAVSVAALFAVAGLAACGASGSEEGGLGPSGTGPGSGGSSDPSGDNGSQVKGAVSLAPRLRLKSNAELSAAIREVFGVTLQDKKALPPEGVEVVSGFSNNSNAYQVGETLFIAMQNLSANVSAGIADAVLLKHCTGANATGASCGKAFISNYGRLLFARDVTAEEVTTLLKVHAATYVAGADKDALRALAETMLQMPSFLYRTEAGAPNSKNATNRMTAFEVAAALSSFLWESPPDAALLDAAATGKLATSADVEVQARRLLADSRARSAFARFALQWLDIRDIELQTRDVKTFPGFSPAVVSSMLQETQKFAEATVFDGDSTLKTLLSGKSTYLDKTLSDFYGFGAVSSATLTSVPLPSLKAGILSQGSFMLAHAGDSQTSPIKRGAFVRRRLMCNVIQPAPPTAPTTVDPAAKGQSVKDVFNQDQKPGCLGCHRLMNPIGFGFENLDAVGRTRTTYNNVPIDSSGEIWSMDLAKPLTFSAGTGLFDTLSTMPEVLDCFTLRLYQYAMGRIAGNEDQPTIDGLASSFKKSNGRIVDLMVQIAASPAFVTRNTL